MTSTIAPSATQRRAILNRTTTIALLGASDKLNRASYFVATYLLSSTDYRVFFVNPRVSSILGHQVYPSLADLPETPDLVAVFRRHEELPGVLAEVIERGSKTLWLQLGISDDDIARDAAAHGLDVVMNRCVKIEHARFQGGLHMAGFDTGVISSKRQPRG